MEKGIFSLRGGHHLGAGGGREIIFVGRRRRSKEEGGWGGKERKADGVGIENGVLDLVSAVEKREDWVMRGKPKMNGNLSTNKTYWEGLQGKQGSSTG